MSKRTGSSTVIFDTPPVIAEGAAVGGHKESEGPLRERFDILSEDSYFGQKSWEKAESCMLGQCFDLLCKKSGIAPAQLHYLLSGDLQSQCTASAFALREAGIPFLGLYGACSTMGEAMGLGAMLIDGGAAVRNDQLAFLCRRAPVPHAPPLRRPAHADRPAHRHCCRRCAAAPQRQRCAHHPLHRGQIVDAGVTDANNMGAAMAPAALDTLQAHFADTGRTPAYYDAVITGDLGHFGHDVLADLAHAEGLEFPNIFTDCGILLYNAPQQDVHAGGSGCGCSASVFAGHILKCMQERLWNRVLFAPTGALMSLVTSQQGESIPGICHAIAIENTEVKRS